MEDTMKFKHFGQFQFQLGKATGLAETLEPNQRTSLLNIIEKIDTLFFSLTLPTQEPQKPRRIQKVNKRVGSVTRPPADKVNPKPKKETETEEAVEETLDKIYKEDSPVYEQ